MIKHFMWYAGIKTSRCFDTSNKDNVFITKFMSYSMKMGKKLPFVKDVLKIFLVTLFTLCTSESGGVLIIAEPQYMREKSFLMVAHLVGKDLVICAHTHTHTNKYVCVYIYTHIFVYISSYIAH